MIPASPPPPPAPPRPIARDTALNIAGLGLPLLAALLCIPPLLQALGTARFGVLTLLWAVGSFVGLFDMGMGRVLAQQLAKAWQLRQYRRTGPLVGTALLLLALMGGVAALAMGLFADSIAGLMGAQAGDRAEIATAVVAMALATPAAILTAGLRGVLEARGAFVAINLLRLPLGLLIFVGPLVLVSVAESRLDSIAWLLCAGRWLGVAAHGVLAARRLGSGCGDWWPRARLIPRLARAGGWMTVSNVVSPFMGYVDRFLLGAAGSATAVAYYVTPLELVGRLAIVPAALTAVLLPAFAAELAVRSVAASRRLFDNSVRVLFCLLWPVCAVLSLFAHELLAAWVGQDFAAASGPLLQVFAAGALINSLAYVPYSLLVGAGHVRRIALIHLAELPFFLAALWLLIEHLGAMGAALAWLLRMAVDTTCLFVAAAPLLGRSRRPTPRALLLLVLGGGGFAGLLLVSAPARGAWMLGVALAAWLLYRQTAADLKTRSPS